MSLAVVNSCVLMGMQPHAVQVEVHIGAGLPAFSVVGLPDTGVRESRERVRSALQSSGFNFPVARITVNLAPADLPKDAAHFDLPIAMGILLASGQLAVESEHSPSVPLCIDQYMFAGELSLTGALLRLAAPVAVTWSAAKLGFRQVVVPQVCAEAAAQVSDVQVYGASSLPQLVEALLAHGLVCALPEQAIMAGSDAVGLCMSEVKGQQQARHAIEIAAAGRHNVLLRGTPGVGKSMLAQRLITVLPELSEPQRLDVAVLAGVAGRSEPVDTLPPFRSPHHSASTVALVGGSSPPKPGEISLAHHGVLFLDEVAEFTGRALEALREPLETGGITIARAGRSVWFPADFQLVAAMNPCPCGWLGHAVQHCLCTPERIERYRAKLSGPFMDRLDLCINLKVEADVLDATAVMESSVQIRKRVECAQAIQHQRQGCLNSRLDDEGVALYAVLGGDAEQLLRQCVRRWGWSGRSVQRARKVARTIADLAGVEHIQTEHLAMAIQYRG